MVICETCKYWERDHTSTPWFPPHWGDCTFMLPPHVTRLLEKLAPSYVDTKTLQDDICSSHVPRDNANSEKDEDE